MTYEEVIKNTPPDERAEVEAFIEEAHAPRMGRPPFPPGQARTHVLGIRLSADEMAHLDTRRGDKSRAEYIRAVLLAL